MSAVKNYAIIWLNPELEQFNEEYRSILDQLQNMPIDVHTFINSDRCIDFLTDLINTKTFLVTRDIVAQQLVPLIHDLPQVNYVYCFNHGECLSTQWITEWCKVKGISGNSTLLCRAIEMDIKSCHENAISISFISQNQDDLLKRDLNQLDATFMYTQIFKEILLQVKYDDKSIQDFVTHCRTTASDTLSNNILLFKEEYCKKSAIWWYSSPSFLFSRLNHSLRTLQVDTLIRMGFFLSQLHHEIQEMHKQQLCENHMKPFTVYRGQGLSEKDFNQLLKTEHGLISFNNFLSTSRDMAVALLFAESNSLQPGTIGILFIVHIDPSVSSVPFADITQVSYFQAESESEILFSMHTVFRIIRIERRKDDHGIFEVDLQLTSDDDEQLRILTNHIANQIHGDTGWDRLANFLHQVGYLNKAEELYKTLLEQTSNESDLKHYYNQLFDIEFNQGHYPEAMKYALKSSAIATTKSSSEDSPLMASSAELNFISCKTREFGGALFFQDKSYDIEDMNFFEDGEWSTTDQSNMDAEDMTSTGCKSRAVFYEQALKAYQKTLGPEKDDLSISLDNITSTFDSMTIDSQTLFFNEKLLEIREKYLPSNHPNLALSYHNLGIMYNNRKEYFKALCFHQKSLHILEKLVPINHPDLGAVYNQIAGVYHSMEEYSNAYVFYEKTLNIWENALPSNHYALVHFYSNFALLNEEMEQYSKALEFYEKVLAIHQAAVPPKHDDLIEINRKVGVLYYEIQEYSKALAFQQEALRIAQGKYPSEYILLGTLNIGIGGVYSCMDKYSESLLYFERASTLLAMSDGSNPHLAEDLEEIMKNAKRLIHSSGVR